MKSNFNDLALLLLRLALGSIMWAHGAQKLLGLFGGSGPQGIVGLTRSLGLPYQLGWLVIAIEFFGGIAIALGVLSRLAALGFAAEMAVAIAKIHWRHGFFLGPQANGLEYPLLLAVVALALFFNGPGRYALFGRTQNLLT